MTKDYMSRTFEMDKQVQKLAQRLEYLRYKQTSPRGGELGLGVQNSRNVHAGQDLTVKVIEAEEELDKAVGELTKLEWQILQSANGLASSQKAVIIWRYICRLTWREISKRANLSEMQVHRIHKTALSALSEHIHVTGQGSCESFV